MGQVVQGNPFAAQSNGKPLTASKLNHSVKASWDGRRSARLLGLSLPKPATFHGGAGHFCGRVPIISYRPGPSPVFQPRAYGAAPGATMPCISREFFIDKRNVLFGLSRLGLTGAWKNQRGKKTLLSLTLVRNCEMT